MYSVSQNFKNAIMSTSRILKAKVLINSREYDESYIVEMNYEDTSNPSGSFEIGTVASATLNLSVVGVNEVFETATIKPYIGLDLNGTVEYVPLGVFYCDQVERKKDVVTLTCYDGMIKLEKAYFSDLTYPATITAVMNEICTKAGIQFTGTLPNYSFSKKPEGYKFRGVVAFIAQMCGGFAKFDRDGKLRIKSYTTTSETITADHYMDDGFSKKKDAVFRIDKITCQTGENTISKGTLSAGGSEVQFENPFMTDGIMTDIYNKLKGFQYLPVYLKFVGNPAYEVGDIVTLVTVDDEIIQIPIMVNKLAFSGGLTGEIESVGETENSNQFDSSGSLTNKVERVVYELAFINEALINKATIEDLEATNAEIENLKVSKADIEDLNAVNATIQNLQANKADIEDLNAANARIDNLEATKADIDDLDATNARIDNLEATKANITDLDAVNAAIQNLQAEKANITDLNATNARIDNLVTNDLTAINAEITNLKAGKANITDLNATNARVGALEADVGSINTLLAGNLGAENFRAGAIYAGSGVIAEGAIGNAEISNLNASKINAGILNTALVTIQGANGRLKMSGNRLQVFANKTDGSLYERVSLGDVNGDGSVYGLRVRGADGQTVLLDENGVKREGITDGSITNEKIADDANISGTKLDIASVVTEINEGTTTIQSSKIFYNGKTLDVQLGNMVNTVTAQGQTITNHETRITATEQELSTKVSVSQYQQDQAALSSQLSQMSTQIQQQANQIALKADAANVYTKSQIDGQFTAVNTQISNLSAQLTLQADQIATKVSKTEFESLQIGGRNLIKNSAFEKGDYNGWSNSGSPPTRTVVDINDLPGFTKALKITTNAANQGILQTVPVVPNQEYTLSWWAKDEGGLNDNHIQVYYTDLNTGNTVYLVTGTIRTLNWQRYTWNRKFNANAITIRIGRGGGYSNYGTTYFTGLKLELGNRATDWTPAPEDTQSQIDGLGSRMTTAETSITQLSNQIALKANQSTVDNLTNQVTSLSAQLTVQAGQIATKVEKNGVISAINQTAEQIKIQASKVDLAGYVTFTNLSTPGQTTIDGGNITSGYISADRIAAGSITAQHLAIADFTNLSQIDENSNPNGNTVVTVNGKKYFRVGPGSYARIIIARSKMVEFKTNDEYYIRFSGYRETEVSAVNFIVRRYYTDGSWADAGSVNVTPGTSSGIIEANLQITTSVDETKTIDHIDFFLQKDQGTTGYFYVADIELRKRFAGMLIVDGTITAAKLAAKSITADKLNVTSLSAISADLGTVTAGTIKGLTIEGGTINGTSGLFTGSLITQDPSDNSEHPSKTEITYDTFSRRVNNAEDEYWTSVLIGSSISMTKYDYSGLFGPKPNSYISGGFSISEEGINFGVRSASPSGWYNVTIDLDGIHYSYPDDAVFKEILFRDTDIAFNTAISASRYFSGTGYFDGNGASLRLNTDSTSAYMQSEAVYNRTYSGTANVYVTTNGVIGRITSARKYKEDIQEVDLSNGYAERILQLKPKSWFDKTEISENGGNTTGLDRRYGLIAEDVVEAGLPEYVVFTPPDENGRREVDGIAYDRLWTLLIPVTKSLKDEQQTMKDEIEWLKLENQYLKQKIQQLEAMVHDYKN